MIHAKTFGLFRLDKHTIINFQIASSCESNGLGLRQRLERAIQSRGVPGRPMCVTFFFHHLVAVGSLANH